MPSLLLQGSAVCVSLLQHVSPNLNGIFHFFPTFLKLYRNYIDLVAQVLCVLYQTNNLQVAISLTKHERIYQNDRR